MVTIYTLTIIISVLALAFFSAAEMAFTSLNRIKLRELAEQGDTNALKLEVFLGKGGLFLGTTLVGTNIAVVISSVLTTRIFVEYLDPAIAPLAATCVMLPLTLVFAEIVPKTIARQFASSFALRSVNAISGFHRIFSPLILLVNSIARALLWPFGSRKASWDETFTKSDLKRILVHGHEAGEVEADEMELIHKVLDFGSTKVEKIMVPLYRISSLSIDDSTEDLKSLVSMTGYSRVPIYEKSKNNIVGIINIYDILFNKSVHEKEEGRFSDFIRDPVYISREDGLDIALTRLRHRKQPMGIVTGDGDNVVGLVTIEDILEEIVGEIDDSGAKR